MFINPFFTPKITGHKIWGSLDAKLRVLGPFLVGLKKGQYSSHRIVYGNSYWTNLTPEPMAHSALNSNWCNHKRRMWVGCEGAKRICISVQLMQVVTQAERGEVSFAWPVIGQFPHKLRSHWLEMINYSFILGDTWVGLR